MPVKHSIFRTQALEHYMRNREKDVLPHFISPPVFWCFWLIIGLSLLIVWFSWTIQLPVYQSARGTIVVDKEQKTAQALLFWAANQQPFIHVGMRAQLQIDGKDSSLLLPITEILPATLSPAEIRQRYHLDAGEALLVTQPSLVIVIALSSHFPTLNYEGSIIQAQIQVGERSLFSSLLSIDQGSGG